MKRVFVLIVIFGAMLQPGNASANDVPGVLFTNILEELGRAKLDLDNHVVKATVITTINLRRRRTPEATIKASTNDFQLRQFDLQMGLFKWGYVAQQTLSGKPVIASGKILNNWSVRSNALSLDASTYANPTVSGIGSSKRDIDVKIHSGFEPSFVFFTLIIDDIKSFLGRMDNISVTRITNLLSETQIQIKGNLNSPDFPEEEFRMVFDPAHRMFPIEGSIYMDGQLLNKWIAVYSTSNRNTYFPEVFTTEVVNNGKMVMSTVYSNITVEVQQAKEATALIDVQRIPKGSVVNEYRFGHPFAYVQGVRNPTSDELLAMSTNQDAIIKYQQDAQLVGPLTYTSSQRKGRWIVIAVMIISTSVVFLYLMSKNSKA